jgi:hypothetical protein
MKLLEENVGRNVFDIDLRNEFCYDTKSMGNKSKNK